MEAACPRSSRKTVISMSYGPKNRICLKSRCIERYFRFYNHERLHQSLDYRTPAEIYQGQAR